MAQSLYRKYFNIVPINNITTFSVSSGVDQISFMIPPLAGAALSTRDLVLSGNILMKIANLPCGLCRNESNLYLF